MVSLVNIDDIFSSNQKGKKKGFRLDRRLIRSTVWDIKMQKNSGILTQGQLCQRK